MKSNEFKLETHTFGCCFLKRIIVVEYFCEKFGGMNIQAYQRPKKKK